MNKLFTQNIFKRLFITLAVIMSFATTQAQTLATIGTQTNVNANTGWPAPYGNWYWGARQQYLILASELTAAGITTEKIITSLGFNVATVNGVQLQGFNIQLGLTTATSLTGTWHSGPMTTVYTANYTETSGWNTHTFSNPFIWDGTSNIVVEVCFNNGSYTYNAVTYYTNTSFNSCNYYYQDATGVCTNTSCYGALTSRPNMRLNMYNLPALDIVANNLTAPASFGVGNNTLTLRYSNYGSTAISSADFGYQLGTATPVTETSVAISPTLASAQSRTHTFATPLNIPSGGTYTLKVWARRPNATVDPQPNNDTITLSICTGLAGAYTIDPAGSGPTNFTSFSAAVAALNNCGVVAPVTFTVASGTYTEQIVLNQITGASATNTITFDGVDSTTRILTYNSTNANNNATFQFNGADYVTLKNLTIRATNTSYSYAVQFINDANYNIVEKCALLVPLTTSGSSVPVAICGNYYYTTGNNGNYNIIRNNRCDGGYITYAMMGSSGTSFSQGNKFLDNLCYNAYYMGIYAQYNNGQEYSGNRIYLRTATTTTYGVYLYYNNNYRIERNIISAQYMGLYIYFCDYTNNPGTSWTTNNILFGFTYSTTYPVYHYYTSNNNFFHNTVYQTGTGNTGYGAYVAYGAGNHFRNNIFYNVNNIGTASWCLYALNSSPFATMDYNIYYTTHPTNYVYMGAASSTLAALKTLNTTFNKNSLNDKPTFVNLTSSPVDLHISPLTQAKSGDRTVNIAYDVDNEARCTFAPTIGADESKYPTPAPVANFVIPDTVYINSPATFYNNNPASAPMAHEWFVDGVAASTNVNLLQTFTATGTYSVKLKTQSCGGVDSITKTVTVVNPTRVPQSDFISNVNIIDAYETVSFQDLSQFGPSSWVWSVSPGSAGTDYSFTNGTTPGSQNPQISFSTPGYYTICMEASNSIGAGNNECKTRYVSVRSSNYLCIYPFSSTSGQGVLFDDGGPNGNYSNNLTGTNSCFFLIDPCATSVSLTFTQFNFAANDFIRIFNGPTTTSPAIHPGSGYTGVLATPFTVTANSGKMLVQIITDAGTNAPGFVANWTSVTGTYPPPTGTILGPDTAWTGGSLTTYSSSYVDANASYIWDFENDGIDDAVGQGLSSAAYSFAFAGVTVNKLTITNCGGTLVLYDTIDVVDPTSAPVVDFVSNLLVASGTDTLKFTDLSTVGPVSWKWTFTGPASPIFVSSNSLSQNPRVILNIPGTYTVKLVACNSYACDSATKTAYINIIGYCNPVIGTLNPDMAISKVVFAGINWTNTTPAPGSVPYRNLTQTAPMAVVDRGGVFPITVERNTAFNNINRKVWIDYNKDGVFDPITELAATQTQSSAKDWTGSITIPSTASLGITRMRIGTAFANYSNTPCGPNTFGEFNDFRVNVTPDITLPVITLTGSDTSYVEIGRTYTDPGYSASDNVDGVITSNVVVTGFQSGTQVIDMAVKYAYYNVSDAGGNNAEQKVRVIMPTADVTKPVITMVGGSPQIVEVKTSYTDSGATATDFFFGSITPSIMTTSTVDINRVGTYTVTYNVMDLAGNAATPVVRTVIVRDTQKPVITLIGSDTIRISVYSIFVDPGANVTDNYDNGLGYSVSGAVNTNLLGSYVLSYNTTDANGNVATTKTRVVIVQDVTAPQITMVPPDTMYIEVNTFNSIPEPGYLLKDNYYPNAQLTVAKTGSVNLNALGTYTIQYYVSDPSGNVDSSAKRVYKVVDTTKPVMTLNGAPVINWCRWKPFVDPGVTVSDNFYSGLTATVGGNLDVNKEGIYVVSYNVTDGSGNKAVEVTRLVSVTTCANGIDNSLLSALNVYPNPTNGLLNININLEVSKQINVAIYNSLGELVKTVANAEIMNGNYTADMSQFAAGIYFVKFEAGNESVSKKVTLIK